MTKPDLKIEAFHHRDAKRANIPTAELEPVMTAEDKSAVRVAYERRNRDLDPQLVWRGKDVQDEADLTVAAPPLYIQEKIHPKVLIDALKREKEKRAKGKAEAPLDLFADFDGIADEEAKTEFYKHDSNWSNRFILGDSLSVMASLAEREGLRGKVQCIYFDPPYGIKFNSNFQWSTTSRDVKDGDRTQVTREPEQVKAFRDTWKDGIHSYLSYIRDRLTVARDLLTESGSIFVQIGDENVHRVRAVMDEVFGDENFLSSIAFTKTRPLGASGMAGIYDQILWYSKDKTSVKTRNIFENKSIEDNPNYSLIEFEGGKRRRITSVERKNPSIFDKNAKIFQAEKLASSGWTATCYFDIEFCGKKYPPKKTSWRTNKKGIENLIKSNHLHAAGDNIYYVSYFEDNKIQSIPNLWDDTRGDIDTVYVVQTSVKVVQRCLLMATDPGDLVLDPTCGSGTTAFVSEQWGRRWITIDTSRVALALARSRLMGARFAYYLLADSPEGVIKEAELTLAPPKSGPTYKDLRHGFVFERVPRITLGSIANNTEIPVIWEKWQETLEPLRASLNTALGKAWEEWEIPREAGADWTEPVRSLHARWWDARIARQKEIDASIAAKAEFEYLYDKPYEDKKRVRVAGPFTVESLSPHRVLAVGADDELIDLLEAEEGRRARGLETSDERDFTAMVLANLSVAGVQQAHKADRITFTRPVEPFPGGGYVCAHGVFLEGETERKAAIFVGPEFGTVARPDLVAAAREAADAGFDVLIACAFNFDAHTTELARIGRIPVLKARMNPDLHMGGELKTTGSGNLFVIFGEPDIRIENAGDDMIRVEIRGIDVFKPQSGEIESGGPDSIALWFIDTDYDEESFFVRHAYFLGANDPYKSLKTTLKAEIDPEAWESLRSAVSRPFPRPASGRIAVKAINHLGDEVMKVFRV